MDVMNGKTLLMVLYLLSMPFTESVKSRETQRESPVGMTYYINPADGDDSKTGTTKEQAWRTFAHINQLLLSPGDCVEIVSQGSFDQTLLMRGEGTVDHPVEIRFAPGRYDFFTENAFKTKYNISNTNDGPDSLKAVGILFKNAKNFIISGKGAEIIYHHRTIEVCMDSCENISISGFHFDYHRPTVSEFKVLETGSDYAEIEIHKDSAYKIENGRIQWTGEGWTDTTGLAQELDPKTNEVWRIRDPLLGLKIEETKPFMIRSLGQHKLHKGKIYQIRDIFRDCAAVFIRQSKYITWRDVAFHYMHGMGIVSQFSENLTFDSIVIAPDSTSGRTTAAWADGMHLSGCRGKILVKNCIFSGAHDDAVNIHGTYLQIVEKLSDNRIKIRFMHPQTYGFMAFHPGDEIEFVDRHSYQGYGHNKVKEVTMPDPKEMVLTLEESASPELEMGDVIENVTWTPEIEIRGCTVSRIPTHGFLLSTRRKVLVEGNEFLTTHMSAILIGIDANKWYESGCVRDMTIRNNKFVRCGEPVILVEPMNRAANDAVHQNIRIEKNEFVLRNETMVGAKSTRNLRVKGNTIYSEKKLNDGMSIKTSDCVHVKTGLNTYLITP